MSAITKFFSLIIAGIVVTACQTTPPDNSFVLETGMFKVAILYPNGEGKTFDMDYYETSHMPMVASFLGENLKFYEIDEGLAGRTPEDQVPFLAVGYFYVANIDEYNQAIGQHLDAVVSDFENYTNIQPVVQISEIKQIERIDPDKE